MIFPERDLQKTVSTIVGAVFLNEAFAKANMKQLRYEAQGFALHEELRCLFFQVVMI